MSKTKIRKASEIRPLEDHIKIIIEKVIQERELNLAAEEKHFHAMGLMLMENFKPEE